MKFSSTILGVMIAAILCTTVAFGQWDSTVVYSKELGGGVYYIGLGPDANAPATTVVNQHANEVTDSDSLLLGIADEGMTDSAEIVVKCFHDTVTNKYRAVIRNITVNQVLANISFRPTSNPGEYELDIPSPPLSTVQTVDSIREGTLRWTAFGTYFVTAQMLASVDPTCYCADKNNTCNVYYPHDDICSGFGSGGTGPFNINQVRVYVPCYGTTWISLLKCCENHDRELWCTHRSVRGVAVQGINLEFFGCVAGTIATEVASRTPWYCGGAVTGMLFGTAQGYFIAASAWLVVVSITNGQLILGDNCFISAGRELNSCMCGGNVQTFRCRDNMEMCAGTLGLSALTGPTGEVCFCDANAHTMEISPAIPGATYTWTASGDATVTPDNGDGHTAQVTAHGNGIISVLVEIPGCGLQKLFTKKVTNGAPPEPVITTLGGAVPTCIPRRPGTLFVVDHAQWNDPPSCPTEYKLEFDNNVGGTVMDGSATNSQWSTKGNWFTARPDNEGTFCVTVWARNQCGTSSKQYCVTVDDDCPPVTGTRQEGELGVVSTREALQGEPIPLYPNPADNSVTIELGPSQVTAGASIVDATGKVLRQIVLHEHTNVISIGDLPLGMYIIRIESPRGDTYRPFVVVR